MKRWKIRGHLPKKESMPSQLKIPHILYEKGLDGNSHNPCFHTNQIKRALLMASSIFEI